MTITLCSLVMVFLQSNPIDDRQPPAPIQGRALAERPRNTTFLDDQDPVKEKGGRTIVKDKSKPVRKALVAQYAKLAEAVQNKDWTAFQALRTDDFHTVDEHGRPQSSEQMAQRARAMLARIQSPIRTTNAIGIIELLGN